MALFPDRIYSIYMYTYIDYVEDDRFSRITAKSFSWSLYYYASFFIDYLYRYHMNTECIYVCIIGLTLLYVLHKNAITMPAKMR